MKRRMIGGHWAEQQWQWKKNYGHMTYSTEETATRRKLQARKNIEYLKRKGK
jgi:hypothetical protein